MAFIVRDTNPQYGGQCFFVGTRKIKAPNGRDAEAADFGERANARQFPTKSEANKFASLLNKIANCSNQFVVEEVSIYSQQYGRARRAGTNGFNGFGTLPSPQPSNRQYGGFDWQEPQGGYNGF